MLEAKFKDVPRAAWDFDPDDMDLGSLTPPPSPLQLETGRSGMPAGGKIFFSEKQRLKYIQKKQKKLNKVPHLSR